MSSIDPNSPVVPPPANVQANPDARSELNTPAFVEVWLSLVLVTIVAVARLVERWRVSCVSRPHVVDIMAFLSYTLYIGVIYCIYRIVAYDKMFVHQWDFRVGDMTGLLRIKFVAVNLYNPLILLLKSAILFEWIRIFLPIGKRNAFFWSCQLLAWTNILFYVAETCIWNLACTPYEKNWNSTVPGSCMNFKALDTGSGVINFGTNLVMVFLPIATVRRLDLSGQMRLGLFALFGFGLLACISSAFRLVSGIYFYISEDLNYHFSSITLWVVAEMTCGFIVLCAPSVPVAVSVLLHTRFFSNAKRTNRMEPAIHLNNVNKSRAGTRTSNDDQDAAASAAVHNTGPWRDGASEYDGNSDGTFKIVKRTSQLGSVPSSYRWLSDVKGSRSSSNNHNKAIKPKNKNGESSSHGRNNSGLSLSALTEALHSSLAAATSTEQLRSSSTRGSNRASGNTGDAVSGNGGILCTTQIVTTEDFVQMDERMKEVGGLGWRSPWEEREADEEQEQELGVSVRVL